MQRKRLPSRLMERLTEMPYAHLLFLWLTGVVICALLYFLLSTYHPLQGLSGLHEQEPLVRLFNSLYFSVVTATTVGYGDIAPHGLAKLVVMIEATTGFFVFAMFVTKLVSQREEIALHEVYRGTFEDIFTNTREGLYIVRRDLDGVISEAKKHATLSDHAWENLRTAYLSAQSLIGEIPDFYDAENRLYTIDATREVLLFEAVHRTLHRINTLLDTVSARGIDWLGHEPSTRELLDLLHVVTITEPLWRERSPYGKAEAFADILRLHEEIHRKTMQSVSS